MKKTLLILLFSFCLVSLFGQQNENLSPCGTKTGKTTWLKEYQKNRTEANHSNVYKKTMDSTLYVPMSIHILRKDNGQDFISVNTVLDAMCTLNADWAVGDIQYLVNGDINFISNSSWLNHSTVLEGAEMMFTNNIPHSMNTYFVTNPAGNCGYNLPYAGMAMSKNCSDPTDHTWSHEVGHNLSLPHPFLGWEGGVSHDGSVNHNYSNPAPTTITYDYTYFKDTLIPDTLIIDTIQVEYVARTNCYEAADGFCDTEADYLSYRWNCNLGNGGLSNEIQTDPDGVTFNSNGNNIMSYADDACANTFSPEQIAAARANLLTEKADYLVHQDFEVIPINEDVSLISPVESEITDFSNTILTWSEVENATHYVVEVSYVSAFNIITHQEVVTGTSVVLPELLKRKHYWRIRPFNNGYACTNVSEAQSFTADEVDAVATIKEVEAFSVVPTIVESGQNLFLNIELTDAIEANIVLISMNGQQLHTEQITFNTGKNRHVIETNNLAKGIYILTLQTTKGILNQKVIIQ